MTETSDNIPATWPTLSGPGTEPSIPPAKQAGHKRLLMRCEMGNGVMYKASRWYQLSGLPKDLPPRSTVNDYFFRGAWDGTLGRIHYVPYIHCCEQTDREVNPTATFIVSQSVKGAEKRGRGSTRRAAHARRSRARSATSWLTPRAV